ncbi:hypothetical protein CS063_10430 [Sporanaerobium hydrogeniformans]|uniref:Uncharacterized protein n=1 Tax=Sporanaerobium hydrogeniformans TaxID=3072179 RepID=A0AC61DCM3_9FIRM|nr:LTA synthase family protein [Sporanaerobium hydrogeniformans]PHV70496.1 hypothetical protein CS063_10430 [Sporanaerobium hydrogeniformans]
MASGNLGIKIKPQSHFRINKHTNYSKELWVNVLVCLIVPFIVAFGLEFIARGLKEAMYFTKEYPKSFLLNGFLMMALLSPAIFARRAHLAAALWALPWALASFASYVLSKVRGVPFIWSDLYSMGDGMSIASQYLTKPIILRLGALIVLGGVLLVVFYKLKFKRYTIHWSKKLFIFFLLIIVGVGGISYLKGQKVVQIIEWDTMQSYKRNGFAYSFMGSFLSTFRKAPEQYSKETIEEIMAGMNEAPVDDEDMPNIIMVQLEGVFDPTTLKGVTYSGDPIPNIRKYLNSTYSGRIQVPTLGGGTARTEFEVLAGINMDYLSPGEIPYNSGMVNKGPIETLAYIFKDKGYATTGIHNFEGNFYSRHTAFKNLGFDKFISMETMNNVDRSKDYPKDDVLVDYIKKSLESTSEKDFIFTIAVETHGPYNYEYDPLKTKSPIKVISNAYEKRAIDQLQNYIDRLHGTDAFVGALADYIDSLTEETILVVYSDHYPALDVLEDVGSEDKYQTPYFIMSNMNNIVKRQHHDMEAYQLGTEMLELIDMSGGIMNNFHTTYREEEDYLVKLEQLQYDMLFGKKYSTHKKNLYEPTIIQLGLEQVEIEDVTYEGNQIVITGKGFTDSSHIFLGDKLIETEFVSETKLIGQVDKEENKPVVIKQLGRNDKAIVASEAFKKAE